MEKKGKRRIHLFWMGVALLLTLFSASCRTIDCGCPMAVEEEVQVEEGNTVEQEIVE